MADKEDPKAYAKYVRYLPETERLMRQFLKLESGAGNNSAYNRGYTFNFEFTQEQRDAVMKLMDEKQVTFGEAFDEYQKGRNE